MLRSVVKRGLKIRDRSENVLLLASKGNQHNYIVWEPRTTTATLPPVQVHVMSEKSNSRKSNTMSTQPTTQSHRSNNRILNTSQSENLVSVEERLVDSCC
mmetsp:Transcript_117531/g.184825  ORF Transcript_117531/g.184825 Transcript_117531/m.184825 type:complete len:100 (-) Transcript_117531:1223-1522(-)